MVEQLQPISLVAAGSWHLYGIERRFVLEVLALALRLTIAGLVSITPEPPLPALPLLERKMICPPEPFKRSAPANTQAAYLRRDAVASEGSPEAPSGVMSPAHAPGNSPSIELAWRVVHAAETRKAALLEQRAYALRDHPCAKLTEHNFSKPEVGVHVSSLQGLGPQRREWHLPACLLADR
eukprot:s7730_g2.t1